MKIVYPNFPLFANPKLYSLTESINDRPIHYPGQ
jgi:hypothetical protein